MKFSFSWLVNQTIAMSPSLDLTFSSVIIEKFCSFGRGIFLFLAKSQISWSTKSSGEGTISFRPSELRCLLHGYFWQSEHPSVDHQVPLMIKHLCTKPRISPMTTCLISTLRFELSSPWVLFQFIGEVLLRPFKCQNI